MFDGVFDANVLLDFSEAGAVHVLARLFGTGAHVAEHVRTVELSKGVLKGRPDPCIVGGSCWVTIVTDIDTNEYQLTEDLVLRLGEQHRGEAQSIALCYYRRLVFVTRDGKALRAAANRGIAVTTTTGILNEAIRHAELSADDALAIARRMEGRGVRPFWMAKILT